MEAPLNRKVQDRIERFEPVWKEAMSYALHLSGHEVDVQDISVRWEKVETVQPRTQAEIRSLGVQAGIPLITLLKDEGWSETQIVDLLKEQKLASAMMADSLLANFEKGQA
jgi:hypothetical protein